MNKCRDFEILSTPTRVNDPCLRGGCLAGNRLGNILETADGLPLLARVREKVEPHHHDDQVKRKER